MKKKKQKYPVPTDASDSVAEDSGVAYVASNLPSYGLHTVFGLRTPPSSDYDWLSLSRAGLSKSTLLALAKRISLTIQEFASVMHISERTLQRYSDHDVVRPEYTSRAVELARLYERGVQVFGTMEAFNSWMKTPSYAFNNETPFQLLDTAIGYGLVWDEIGRIEHGIFV